MSRRRKVGKVETWGKSAILFGERWLKKAGFGRLMVIYIYIYCNYIYIYIPWKSKTIKRIVRLNC